MKNSELSPASRRKDRELLIIVSLFGLSLLHELILATGLFSLSRPLTFGVRLAQLFLAERCIQFVDLRSNKWLLIPWAGMLVVFLTSFFRDYSVLMRTTKPLGRTFLAYALCPLIGLILSEGQIKRFLKILASVWTIYHFVFCVTGLYCAFSGIVLRLPGTYYNMGSYDGVFVMIGNGNSTGCYLAVAIGIALIGFALFKSKAVKTLFLLSCLPMVLGISMSRSRTGCISAAFVLTLFLLSLTQGWLAKKVKRTWLRAALTLLLAVILAVPLMLGISESYLIYNQYISGELPNPLISSARAEASVTELDNPAAIRHYELTNKFSSNLFSGREKIWADCFRLLGEQPILLLTGTSIPLVMERLQNPLINVHNMPLQILMETGIWGALLLLALLFLFFLNAWRLFFSPDTPLWIRCFPIPCLGIFFIEQMECLTTVDRPSIPVLIIFMLFCSLTIIYGRRYRPSHDKSPEVTIPDE